MKNLFCASLALVIPGMLALPASSQEYDRQDRSYGNSRYDNRDSRSEDRIGRSYDSRRDVEERRSASRDYGRDANATADSNDSWTEWVSDWWSDDSESTQSSDRSERRGGRTDSGVEGFVRRHDSNDDGYLSRSELPSNLRQGMERLDRDDDGYLSRSELQRHAEKAMARQAPVSVTYIWVLDANHGRVKLNDLQEAYDVLTKIDQDNDGEITRQELNQRQQQIASQFVDKCFQNNDDNGDEQITRDEARGTTLSQRFDRLDRNSDDKLTRVELRQAMQNRQTSSQSQEPFEP